jgi:hypothetical protein
MFEILSPKLNYELLLGRGGNLFQPSTLQTMNSAKQFSMLITDSLVDNSS